MADLIGAIATLRATADRLDELNLSGHAADIRRAAEALAPRDACVVRLPLRPRLVGHDRTRREGVVS